MGLSIHEYVLIPHGHAVRKKMHVQVSPSHPVPIIRDDRSRFDESTMRDVFAYMQRYAREQGHPDRFRPVDQWLQLNNASEFAQGFFAAYHWLGGQWWQFGSIHVPLKLGPRPQPGVKDERTTAANYHYLIAKHCMDFTTDVHRSVVEHVKGVKTFTGLQVVGPMVQCEIVCAMPAVMPWLTVRTVSGDDVPIS